MKAVPGYEGYFVNEQGEVFSTRRYSVPRKMKTTIGTDGYPQVSLRVNGRGTSAGVHVLIALAYIGPRPKGQVVRHKDGDSSNSVLSNLWYGTPAENARDTVDHGHHHLAKLEQCVNGHDFTEENTYYRPSPPGTAWRTCRRCAANRQAGYDQKSRVMG